MPVFVKYWGERAVVSLSLGSYFCLSPSLLLISELLHCSVITHNQQIIISMQEKVGNTINGILARRNIKIQWPKGQYPNMSVIIQNVIRLEVLKASSGFHFTVTSGAFSLWKGLSCVFAELVLVEDSGIYLWSQFIFYF